MGKPECSNTASMTSLLAQSLSSRNQFGILDVMKANKMSYPSDLSDEQWATLGPLIRAATRQPGSVDRRRIVNAIFYQLRTGCQWRYLPREYPNWKTVYSCFWRWQRRGVCGIGCWKPSSPRSAKHKGGEPIPQWR
jgi:hypothetical protein